MDNTTSSTKVNQIGFVGFLRSERFILLTCFVFTIPLMVHTANLLIQVSMVKSIYYAYFFAFGFDLAIFTFAINGHRRAAAGMMFVVFFLNIFYFNLYTFYIPISQWTIKEWVNLSVTVVISFAASYCLHAYVTMYADKQDQIDEVALWQESSRKKNQELIEANHTISKLEKEVDLLKAALYKYQTIAPAPVVKGESSVVSLVQLIETVLNLSEAEKKSKLKCTECNKSAFTARALEQIKRECGCLKPKDEYENPILELEANVANSKGFLSHEKKDLDL